MRNNIWKLLIVLVTIVVSLVFDYNSTDGIYVYFCSSALVMVFGIMFVIFLNLKGKIQDRIIYFLGIILGIFIIWNILDIILIYFWEDGSLYIDNCVYYYMALMITLINAFFDIKKKREIEVEDILIMIVCGVILFTHYRYYIDGGFAHNLANWSKDSSIYQVSFNYVFQYYIWFVVILIILNVSNYIMNIKINLK